MAIHNRKALSQSETLTLISFTAPLLRAHWWILQQVWAFSAAFETLLPLQQNVNAQMCEASGWRTVHIRRVKYREAFEQWQLCSCSPLITNSPGGQCGLHNSVTPTRPEKPHQLNESTSLTRALLNSWSVWQIVSAHYSRESFAMHNSLGNLNFYIFKSLWSSCSRIKCLHCLFYSCWLLEEVVVDVCSDTLTLPVTTSICSLLSYK